VLFAIGVVVVVAPNGSPSPFLAPRKYRAMNKKRVNSTMFRRVLSTILNFEF